MISDGASMCYGISDVTILLIGANLFSVRFEFNIGSYFFFIFSLDEKTKQKNQVSPWKLLRIVHSRNSMLKALLCNSISSLPISAH